MIKPLILVMGLAGGLTVGASVAAFYTVLGVISSITGLANEKISLFWVKMCLTLGALSSCIIYFFDINISGLRLISIPLGLICGIFVGVVAAALTETLDILTIASDTLNLGKYVYTMVWIIILGKVIGSAIYFINY
ncbi:MAG TPA: stage V sporulation protein AB [Bacillota bacterium]|nr:stage V sporulation protein AB [Bacillota bacterium]